MPALCALTAVGGCTSWVEDPYDPIAETPHRVYDSTAQAMAAVLAEEDATGASPTVFAVGEYHPTRAAARTPMQWFVRELLPALAPRVQHMVIETWPDAGCDAAGAAFDRTVGQLTARAPAAQAAIGQLRQASQHARLVAHILPMSCIERAAIVDARGRLDVWLLLHMLTRKLGETATRAARDRGGVIVYGGALHNDLYPRWPLGELSYAVPLAEQLGGHVLELDIVLPDVIDGARFARDEPWFPLMDAGQPGQVVVFRRGPHSFVLIVPAPIGD